MSMCGEGGCHETGEEQSTGGHSKGAGEDAWQTGLKLAKETAAYNEKKTLEAHRVMQVELDMLMRKIEEVVGRRVA